MTTQEIIDTAEGSLLHTYNRYQVVFDHGDGVRLYDHDGREYLDFVAGIAVFALGYNNKEYNDAMKNQIDKLMHTSNYYYSEPSALAAQRIVAASGLSKVFLTNSGAEAIEGALKAAKKYAYLKDGKTDHEIIAMNHSFHGRTLGALSVTGNPHYREAFEPLVGTVRYADYNDLESVKALVNDKTCAIIMETIQGEGGIYPAAPEFIKGVRALCDEKDIVLILDEIQCGMGRSGSMWAFEQYGVKPDILTSAKALGCGFPVGAFLLNDKLARASLVAGDHGTTYGGNPMAGCAIGKVLDLYAKNHIIEHVAGVAPIMEETLLSIKKDFPQVLDVRGRGLMWGMEFNCPVAPIINKALEKGLVLINAGTHILRFVPPLIVTEEDIKNMSVLLREAMKEVF